ncbi:MAG: hypothetical protein IJX86_12160 [Lachnospiraceae bacterium]|nr:hypothetical protein [Lachnospiraceae bacterium]
MKKRFALLIAMIMLFAMTITASAEDTADYTFTESEVVDFCVYNIWGKINADCSVANISSIQLTVTVSDFAGDPIDVRLYNRESLTWGYWRSDIQTIDKDGTYVFYIDLGDNAYPSENLCTIYLKDVKCALKADEDPENAPDKAAASSGITAHIVMEDCEFNVPYTPVVEEAPADSDSTDATVDTSDDTSTDTTADVSQNDAGDDESGLPGWVIPVVIVAVVAVVVVIVVATKKKK